MKDAQIVAALRRLYASEDKPEACTPVDLALITRYLLQLADETEVELSHGTLAVQIGCGVSTIHESQKRLTKIGWLTLAKQKHRGRANRATVMLDALPLDEPLKRTIISPEATRIASLYLTVLKKDNPHRRFHKAAPQRFAFSPLNS
jgi:hypothetical protein